jgi:hypothetical protein
LEKKTNIKENSIFQEPQTEGMVFVSRFWKKYTFAHVKEISIFQVPMTNVRSKQTTNTVQRMNRHWLWYKDS